MRLNPYPVTLVANIGLTCKKINNKIIVNILGGWMPLNKSTLIGGIVGFNSILMDSDSVRVITGDGKILAMGYIDYNVSSKALTVILTDDWADGTYGHIRGSFSFYILG